MQVFESMIGDRGISEREFDQLAERSKAGQIVIAERFVFDGDARRLAAPNPFDLFR